MGKNAPSRAAGVIVDAAAGPAGATIATATDKTTLAATAATTTAAAATMTAFDYMQLGTSSNLRLSTIGSIAMPDRWMQFTCPSPLSFVNMHGHEEYVPRVCCIHHPNYKYAHEPEKPVTTPPCPTINPTHSKDPPRNLFSNPSPADSIITGGLGYSAAAKKPAPSIERTKEKEGSSKF